MSNYSYAISSNKNAAGKRSKNAFSLYLSLHTECPLHALLCIRKYARSITLQVPVFTWYSLYVKISLKAQNRSPVLERWWAK